MFSKTNLVSTLVGAVWSYIGGYLLWIKLGSSFFAGHEGTATGVWKETPDLMHNIIAGVIVAFAFSTIYSKLSNNGHTIAHGATYGLLVGLFIGFGERWYDLAFANIMDMSGTIINGILNLIFYGILGILTSMVYNKVKSA
ncbi:hypothetical protein [Aestuariivivens sediminis]|uniref:hypothetical protein n=1 Tax=Aestuariivivens sediminis TaxID=2913557 RepID=UPI001F566FEF|nr:hypothetical protein [Aestuariivivens sediminis]